MRIISKFGDYYDSALGFGIDTTCIYVRKKEKIQVPKELKDSIYSSGRYNRYTTPVGNYSYEYRSIFILSPVVSASLRASIRVLPL